MHLQPLLTSFTNLPPASVAAIFLCSLHLPPANLTAWPFILPWKRQSAPPLHIIHSLKSHNCPSMKSFCLPNHSPQENYSRLKDPCKKKLCTYEEKVLCTANWIKTKYVTQIQKCILYSISIETQLKTLQHIFSELSKIQCLIHPSF